MNTDSFREEENHPDRLWRILIGDAEEQLKTLPADSIHLVVTSPPYFALRDYLNGRQVGRENTPDEYCDRLVRIFREVRRVLRDDASVYINIGDTYAGSNSTAAMMKAAKVQKKDLLLIPFRLVRALQIDGWIVRLDGIWHKPNCTPESARDRPTRSHEYVFLLSKTQDYYYDRESVREPNQGKPPSGKRGQVLAAAPNCNANFREGHWGESKEAHGGFVAWNPRGRHRRSVQTVPTGSFKGKTVGVADVTHFAMFPPSLIRPCILASTSEAGCCPNCLAPYIRHVANYEDLEDAWLPSCRCGPADPIPCTVLDIFAGSGTTGVVCQEENRRFIGVELNPDYARLARARLLHTEKRLRPERKELPS